jgi:hypothetical protein
MEKIDKILDSLYNRVIEPTEAKKQLLEDLFDVIKSVCVDKDELISDLDDRRVVGVEMNEDMWYFYRKQSAEYLLDKYELLRKW